MKGEFVDGGDLAQWEKALSTPAQAVLFESPSNPMLDIVDIKAVTGSHGAILEPPHFQEAIGLVKAAARESGLLARAPAGECIR